MSVTTRIEWTDATWNPVTGCTKVSPGCDHCYAETFAERWRGTTGHYFASGFDVRLRRDKLALPLRWRRPRRIFVNSMSDLFHKDVPDDYIARVFAVMAACPQHTFQLLTKRPARMRALLNNDGFADRAMDESLVIKPIAMGAKPHGDIWPLPNVWVGVSVENQRWADIRVPTLLDTCAAIRWISAEPLLGPINLGALSTREGPVDALMGNLDHARGPDGRLRAMENPRPLPRLDWVVAGGESGHGARPMHPNWVRSLRDQCDFASVPFLFKQWGAWAPESVVASETGAATARCVDWDGEAMQRSGKGRTGRTLDGRTHDQYPAKEA
ncbi:DUF5131 family protein [Amycolatopsis echigonensis]|uniref:Phage Gp37/Gp68 family protein n=1 Tax=Amycolatopsis echigonensis TaxID=2576905 RepID=A0A2N3WE95_9PSEU|nr:MULTISPECIES: phage Gp37/Gp68 family protein [Amycolatopsis]MBB2499666.1 phage Gp37/Gp68 family protein [Amycolatopsis echigonensis]PKV92175.1 protein gp37 [Amycolatopsis niigatensis]